MRTPPGAQFSRSSMAEQPILNWCVEGSNPSEGARGNMYCSECGDKLALFKINGRVKSNKEHDLCNKCFRSLLNKVKAENRFTINIDWADRSKCFDNVKENHTLVLKTPNTNDDISCNIKLTPHKACARFYVGDTEQSNLSPPDLVYQHNENPMKWIKHWFHKILDEPFVKQQAGKVLIFWSDEELEAQNVS